MRFALYLIGGGQGSTIIDKDVRCEWGDMGPPLAIFSEIRGERMSIRILPRLIPCNEIKKSQIRIDTSCTSQLRDEIEERS